MTRRQLVQEGARRWAPPVLHAGAVALYGPGLLQRLTSAPSIWDWSLVVVWGGLAISLPFTVRSTWRNRHGPARRSPLAPSTIPLDEVDGDVVRDSIERTDGRVPAVKALREAYPVLGLKDAADLVDRHRAA